MSRSRYCRFLAVLLLWIFFIFSRSLQPGDLSALESRWVLELIRRVLPFEPSALLIRKAAHFIEFAVLGFLAGMLLRWKQQRIGLRILFSLAIGTAIALCDETIQLFIEGRSGSIQDVWIDTAGALAGVLLAVVLRRK